MKLWFLQNKQCNTTLIKSNLNKYKFGAKLIVEHLAAWQLIGPLRIQSMQSGGGQSYALHCIALQWSSALHCQEPPHSWIGCSQAQSSEGNISTRLR